MKSSTSQSCLALDDQYEQEKNGPPDFCAWCIYFQKPQRGPTEEDYRRLNIEMPDEVITVGYLNPLDRPEYNNPGIWGYCSYLEEHFWDIDHLYCQELPFTVMGQEDITMGKEPPRNKRAEIDGAHGKAHVCVNCGEKIAVGARHLMTPSDEWIKEHGLLAEPPEDEVLHVCSVKCAKEHSPKLSGDRVVNISDRSKTVYPLDIFNIENPENNVFEPCAICNKFVREKDGVCSIIISLRPPNEGPDFQEPDQETGLILPKEQEQLFLFACAPCVTELREMIRDPELREDLHLQISPLQPIHTF